MRSASQTTRRQFLKAAAGTAVVGLSDLAGCSGTPATAAEMKVDPQVVRFTPGIAPLMKLLEETAEEKCASVVAEQLRQGVPYRQLLTAFFLMRLRENNPHHAVYRVHAAHELSLEARADERLLPLFYVMKCRDVKDPIPALAGPLPAADKALKDFHQAMKEFDCDKAECAIVALARNQGGRQTMEQLWQYGVRDRSFVGHRAISVASSWRTLQTIGWQHAEPVLRFVVRDQYFQNGRQDKTYPTNLERVAKMTGKLPGDWAAGTADRKATLELFQLLRDGKVEPACDLAANQLTGGKISAGSVWDAVFLAAAEMMVRASHGNQTQVDGKSTGDGMNVRPLHANTTANALHYAFETSNREETRLLVLLQIVAWIAAWNAESRQLVRDVDILKLEGEKLPETPQAAIEEIFALLPARIKGKQMDRTEQDKAARLAFAFAKEYPHPELYLQTARSWTFRKVSDPHDYKFLAAITENYAWVSPEWRPHILAASVHWLHGPKSEDSSAYLAAREALGKSS